MDGLTDSCTYHYVGGLLFCISSILLFMAYCSCISGRIDGHVWWQISQHHVFTWHVDMVGDLYRNVEEERTRAGSGMECAQLLQA